jgi:hypothetical protein
VGAQRAEHLPRRLVEVRGTALVVHFQLGADAIEFLEVMPSLSAELGRAHSATC